MKQSTQTFTFVRLNGGPLHMTISCNKVASCTLRTDTQCYFCQIIENMLRGKDTFCLWVLLISLQTISFPFGRISSQAASSCCHCQKQSKLLGLHSCSRRPGKYSGQFSACWIKHLTNLWWLTQQLFVSQTHSVTIMTSQWYAQRLRGKNG